MTTSAASPTRHTDHADDSLRKLMLVARAGAVGSIILFLVLHVVSSEFDPASRFVSELRAPMLALFSALEASDRVEEGEILPVLLSGDPDSVDSIPRQMTSDDLTRRLRSSIDSEPDYEPEERSLLGRVWRWITGS